MLNALKRKLSGHRFEEPATAIMAIGGALAAKSILSTPKMPPPAAPTPPPAASRAPTAAVSRNKAAAAASAFAGVGGGGSTLLTGVGGIKDDKLNLGKNTLLGG